MAFNYVDAFQSSSQLEYESKQHDAAVELQGRKCYIFMLDREKTEKSEIYNEAINGRIYLPHFEQRALYNTNEWTNNINLNNFVQTEDTMNFEFNFARMVCAIRDLKDKKAGTLIVKNTTEEILHLKTENNRFCLTSKNFVNLLDLDLTKYKSIAAFINDANKKSSVLELSYEGDMEEAKNIPFGKDIADSVAAFLTIVMMPFTYSVENGLMFGFLSWVILKVLTGNAKEVKPMMWISSVLFLIYAIKIVFVPGI